MPRLDPHFITVSTQAPRKRPFSRPAHCLAQLRPQDGFSAHDHVSEPIRLLLLGWSPVRAFHPVRSCWPGWCHRNALGPQLPSAHYSPRMDPPGGRLTPLPTPLGWVSGYNNYCTLRSGLGFPLKCVCGNPDSQRVSIRRGALGGDYKRTGREGGSLRQGRALSPEPGHAGT